MPSLLNTLRQNRNRSSLRSAYLPATNPAIGDPLNRLGSQLGRINEEPMEPLPAVGSYAAGAGLNNLRGERGGRGYSSQYGTQLTGYTSFDDGRMAGPSAGEAWAARNGAGIGAAAQQRMFTNSQLRAQGLPQISPGMSLKQSWQRTGSATDAPRIALTRLRNGVPLNPDEEQLIAGMAEKTPGGMTRLLAGSRAEQKANSRAVLRERGLARGDARAAARNFRAMTSPRNVRLASGGMVSQPGMPAQLAGAMTLAGGAGAVDPMMAALSGMMPGGTAAEFNDTATRERIAGMDRNAADSRTQQAMIMQAMQSEDPATRAWALSQLPASQGGTSLRQPGDEPLPEGGEPSLGLTNDDALALENRRGNDAAIAAYGRSRKWSQDKIAAVQREYGRTLLSKAAGLVLPHLNEPYTGPNPGFLEQGADWLYGQFGPRPPEPVGPNPMRLRRPRQ